MRLPHRKSSIAKVEVPKLVIRARYDYSSVDNSELSFKKDDFFYVLSNPHEGDSWYEVTNPLTGKRGLVPASHFEVMESRQDRINRINRSCSNASQSLESHNIHPNNNTASAATMRSSLGIPHSMPKTTTLQRKLRSDSRGSSTSSQRKPSDSGGIDSELMPTTILRTRTTSIQMQHQHSNQATVPSMPSSPASSVVEMRGMAMYDFDAANGNELTVREGDDVLVVAQSTEDWLIARHIPRGSGAPGLVPASYIQMRDHTTGEVIEDLQGHLARFNMRLRTATEWEKYLRELRMSRSTASTASANSDITTTNRSSGNAMSNRPPTTATPVATNAIGRSGSTTSSNSDEHSPTPRSSIGSILPLSGVAASIQKTRARALTTSSSTSSIADRSSYRHLHKGRQPSVSTHHLPTSENFSPFHPDEVGSVCVPSFICKDGVYLFQLSLKFASGDCRNLYRSYEDFIYCRNQLHDAFPKETGSLKLARFSINSSSMVYLNDTIAERRRSDIDDFVNRLLEMPEEVLVSSIVQRLFGSRVDFQLDSSASPTQTVRRTSSNSRPPYHHEASLSADGSMDPTFVPASASSADTVIDDLHQYDIKTFGGSIKYAGGPYARRPSTTAAPPPVPSVASSVSPPDTATEANHQLSQKLSMASISGQVNKNNASSMVKVKVKLGDDMIALRLPSEMSLGELKTRIALKLGKGASVESVSKMPKIVYHAPSGETTTLSDDQDWATALLASNYKPVLTIVQ